jgi:hypothetical protein
MLALILRCSVSLSVFFQKAKQRSSKIAQMLAKFIWIFGLHVKQVGAQVPLLPLLSLGGL